MSPESIIVIVEDSDDDADLILHALQRGGRGHRVVLLRDGVEALEFLSRDGGGADRPVLVLLDLKLPRVSGLDVLRGLRARGVSAPVPVVVLTTSREERDVLDAYALGANGYVAKPVDFSAFVDAVDRISAYWLDTNVPPPEGQS